MAQSLKKPLKRLRKMMRRMTSILIKEGNLRRSLKRRRKRLRKYSRMALC
jgi:hypothetical protein